MIGERRNLTNSPRLRLESSTTCVVVDSRGSIASLYDKRTNTEFVHGDSLPPVLRLILPLPEWQGHYLESGDLRVIEEPGENSVSVSNGGTVSLAADTFLSSAGEFDLTATITVQLIGSTLRFSLTCHNHTGAMLTEVQFPRIGGLTSLSDDPSDSALLVPGFFQGDMIHDPVRALQPTNGWLTSAPGDGRRLWMYPRILQWADLYSCDVGLYFALEDPELRSKALLLQAPDSTSFIMSWVHYPHTPPGESFSIATARLVLHLGDWHAGADLYRSWSVEHFPPKRIRSAVREQLGWHFAFLRHGDGEVIRRYDELPALHFQARAAGLELLQLFGAHRHGMDRGYPDYEPDNDLGGADGLIDALRQIRRAGGGVALYQAGSAANLFCGQHSADIQTWAVRSGRGELVRADWTWNRHDTNHWIREEPFVLMCYGTGWKEHLVAVTNRYLQEYGATGVHFDHIGDFDFAPCYAEGHHHESPELAASAILPLLEAVVSTIHDVNPDALLICEGMSEVSVPHVDIHWGQNALLRHPAVFRYLYPESLFTTTIQENQYAEAAQAVVAGMLLDVVIELGCGSLGSYPDFARYLLALKTFKAKHKRFLAHGRFVDDRGLTAPDGIYAKAYVVSGAAAAAATNTTDQALRLTVDWTALGVDRIGRIEQHGLDREAIDHPTAHSGVYEIGPAELVLVVGKSENEAERMDLASP